MIELAIDHSHGHCESEQEHSSDQSELSSLPCHPHRPVAVFDFSTIEEQIKLIRKKKQQAKEAARQARRKLIKEPRQIYEADVIVQAFRKSEDLVPSYVRVALKQRTKFIEDKVYLSVQTGNYGSVVSRIRQQAVGKEAVSNELNLVMSQVQLALQSDIAEGIYDVHPIQRSIKMIPKQPEPSHRLKLKNMLIKSKIVDLKEEFNKSEVGSQPLPATSREGLSRVKEEGEIWGDQFHLMSQGTRKATQFVRKIREQQRAIRQKKRSKIDQMKSLEVKSAVQHQQFEQQMKKQRHQQLKRRYQESRQNKQSQKERQQQNQKQYIQFLKQYRGRKPLFRIKQEQYLQQVLVEQQKRRKLKLQQIHQSKLPIDHDNILQHQRNYQKTKQQKQLQAKSQRQMRLKEEESHPRKSFYRGRFHSLIAQQKEKSKQKPDPFLLRDSLLKKQKEFAEFIRKNYAPVISESKRAQLQGMISELSKGRNEKALTQDAYKKLGNEYLKQLRKMIKQLKDKGLLKSPSKNPQPQKAKDYLKQVRQKYNFSTIDYSSQAQSNSQWLENRAIKLQKDAHIQEKVMRLQEDFDIERHMKELDEINQKYIHAAQAKMSLINKLEGEKSNIRTSQNSQSAF